MTVNMLSVSERFSTLHLTMLLAISSVSRETGGVIDSKQINGCNDKYTKYYVYVKA